MTTRAKGRAPNAATVKQAAAGRWLEILPAAGIPAELLDGKGHPCPRCGGDDRFAAFKDVAERGAVHCRTCFDKGGGDGLATVAWIRAIDFPAAVRFVAEFLGLQPEGNGKPRIVATYDYTDENGRLLFQVVRKEPGKNGRAKDFLQRRPKPGGGWIWNVQGIEPVPYRLPDLLAADASQPVVIVEGEKDADALAAVGVIATTNHGGAGKWTAAHAKYLAGRRAVIVPDADEPGEKHAHGVAASLQGIAASVRLIRLPTGKDASEWLAAGGTPENLTELIDSAPEWIPKVGEDNQAPATPNEAIDDPHRLARLYVERFGLRDSEQTLWIWRDDWHLWNGAAYQVMTAPEIRAGVNRIAKDEFNAENLKQLEAYEEKLATGAIDADRDKGPPETRKVTAMLETNVLHALASECLLPGHIEQPTWLVDEAPFPAGEILATTSGLLHLPSLIAGQPCLLDPTPTYFSCNALPYGFDADATCHQWSEFLGTLWPDDRGSIETLQEWFGYCLLPDTRQHKLLMMIGPPRSGKGTIGRTLRAVIGEQNLAGPTLASLAGPFGLWPLLGKLVALIADARLSGRTDAISVVERLLSISGEDPQDVHRKNMPTLAGIRLPVRFVVMTNELPNMRDASGALTTRVILLRLTRSFTGREDKTLGNRLLQELPSILNWSIRGWQRLNERGYFEQPESGQELLDDLQDLASPVGAFVRDCCITGPEFSESVRDLFSCWKEWCEQHGRDRPGTEQTFGRDLRAAIPGIKVARPRTDDGDRERIYNGIGIRREKGI